MGAPVDAASCRIAPRAAFPHLARAPSARYGAAAIRSTLFSPRASGAERRIPMRIPVFGAALALTLLCSPAADAARWPDPYPSTYRPVPSGPVLIRNATVLTGTGQRLESADVLLRDGRVAAVGTGLAAPEGATVVDGTGK